MTNFFGVHISFKSFEKVFGKGGIHCIGTSLGRVRAHINQSKNKSTPIKVLYSGYGSRRNLILDRICMAGSKF